MNPVVIVTGANTGIGRATARALALEGAHVFLACRSEEKTQPVIEEIRRASSQATVEYLPLDLGDFDSIRRCADAFLRRDLPLHVLINNAGLTGRRELTRSGFEVAFGVTYVGHFLLTRLLLDRIKASAPARIVTVASAAHYQAQTIDFDAVRRPSATASGLAAYGVAKLANVLFSAELGRRLEGTGVATYSLHPGVVASDVWRLVPWPVRPLIKLFMLSTEDGARTTLFCATSPECATETGLYYDKCQARTPSAAAQDRTLAMALWDQSERWTA